MAKIAKTNGSPSAPSHEDIAKRAYEIYERNGCQPGHDVENWLAAESELTAEAQKQEAQARPRGTPVSAPPRRHPAFARAA